MTCAASPDPIDAIGRRFAFAAWPQMVAHPSWFDELDAIVGLPVSRRCGRDTGLAEQAVARALLECVGAGSSDQRIDESVPLWALRAHRPMRNTLSTVAALCVLPLWRQAVRSADVQRWDAVLGVGVRHAAVRLWRDDPRLKPPAAADALLQQTRAAAAAAPAWERLCLGLALTALAHHGSEVRARVRLAWPVALRDVEPLGPVDGLQAWAADACERAARQLHAGAHAVARTMEAA
jgi:hypothetical protein